MPTQEKSKKERHAKKARVSEEFSPGYLKALAKEIEALPNSLPDDGTEEYRASLAVHTLEVARMRKLMAEMGLVRQGSYGSWSLYRRGDTEESGSE
jgi:Mn-dependent DtxR family transcriptional regulator